MQNSFYMKNPRHELFVIHKVEKKEFRKNNWTKEEDELLLGLIAENGLENLSNVKEAFNKKFPLNRKSLKNLFHRYKNKLSPEIKTTPWTSEEKHIFSAKHKIYGNNWSKIKVYLPGRIESNIKNYFYSTLRKKLRKILKAIKKNEALKNTIMKHLNISERIDIKFLYELLEKEKIHLEELTYEFIMGLMINKIKKLNTNKNISDNKEDTAVINENNPNNNNKSNFDTTDDHQRKVKFINFSYLFPKANLTKEHSGSTYEDSPKTEANQINKADQTFNFESKREERENDRTITDYSDVSNERENLEVFNFENFEQLEDSACSGNEESFGLEFY